MVRETGYDERVLHVAEKVAARLFGAAAQACTGLMTGVFAWISAKRAEKGRANERGN